MEQPINCETSGKQFKCQKFYCEFFFNLKLILAEKSAHAVEEKKKECTESLVSKKKEDVAVESKEEARQVEEPAVVEKPVAATEPPVEVPAEPPVEVPAEASAAE